MADCMFHGQSSPGPCPQCESNRLAGRDQDYMPPGKLPSGLSFVDPLVDQPFIPISTPTKKDDEESRRRSDLMDLG